MEKNMFQEACAQLGMMLKETRINLKMQAFEVAMKAEMPVSRIEEIENGSNFTCEEFIRICFGLNANPAISLIFNNESKSPTLTIPLNLN